MRAQDPLIGFATESLRFDELLGRGGMGAVYRGLQIRLARQVAIKVIKADLAADPDYRERFVREAQTMGRLIHPNVIACHDFGPIQGPDGNELLVMVMEYVDGSSLGNLAAGERLPVRQVLDWYGQAAGALAAAHQLGIVHRDIKPDNIMVTREGVAKLADFGLARAADSIHVTATGALVGSPAYMSPEASLGHDPVTGSDVYSLACSIFTTLAGRPPYYATSTLQVLHQHIAAPPPAFSAARPDLAMLGPLLTTCLMKDASARPPAATVARDLALLLPRIPAQAVTLAPGKSSVLPAAVTTPSKPTVLMPASPVVTPLQRRLLLLGVIVVGLLALIVAIGLARHGRRQPPTAPVPVATTVPETGQTAAPSMPPVAPPDTTGKALLVTGVSIFGAELMPGHPAAPVGCPAGAGQAPRMLMSQLGKLRLRLPAGRTHVLLLLHPGHGANDRRLRFDGQAVALKQGGWQLVALTSRGTKSEQVLEADVGGPFFCAAAMVGTTAPTWSDLDLRASILVAPEASPLRELLSRHKMPAEFTRTAFVARPLAMRLFGDTARQTIASAFIAGPAPDDLLIETPAMSSAVQTAAAAGTRWCFVLLDGADVPNAGTRADNFCLAVEEALRHGTLVVPVLGGLPMPRNRILWTAWMDQVRKRLPGLPILDLGAVREFHQNNDLQEPEAAEAEAGLDLALRDLRARLTTALRPTP